MPATVRLSREDLLERSGVADDLITALCRAGVITTGPGGFFDEHSVVIAQCAAALGTTAWSRVICGPSGRPRTGSPI